MICRDVIVCEIMLSLVVSICYGAGWERLYDSGWGDNGYSVVQTLDGGFVVVGYGYRSDYWPYDAYIIRTDSLGNILWARALKPHGSPAACATCVDALKNDDVIMVGGYAHSSSDSSYMGYLIRINSAGDTLFTRTYKISGYRDVSFNSIAIISDSELVAVGRVFPSTCNGFLLAKINMNTGETLWTRVYPAAGSSYSVKVLPDGGFILVGTQMVLIRTDSDGNMIWLRRHGVYEDCGYSVVVTADTEFIAVGVKDSASANSYLWMVWVSKDGDTIQTRTYGGPNGDFGSSLTLTFDGNLVVTGCRRVLSYSDVWLLRVGFHGDTFWTRTFGIPQGNDYGYCVRQTSDGGYIVAGTSGADIYLVKTDSLGEVLWVNEIPQCGAELFLSVHPSLFNSACIISATSGSDVEIYDVGGRLIWSSPIYGASGDIQRGDSSPRSIVWMPDESVKSGVYFVRATVGNQAITKRVILIR